MADDDERPPAPAELAHVAPNGDLRRRTTPAADGPFQPLPSSFAQLVSPTLAIIQQSIEKHEGDGTAEAIAAEHARAAQREIDRSISRLCAREIPLKAARVLAGGGGDDGRGPLRTTRALELVAAFMADAPGTIGISGGVGTGKSVAAAWAVAQKVRERYFGPHPDGHDGTWPADYHPRFADVAILSRLPRLPSLSSKIDPSNVWQPFMKCALLAIDDVGMEPDKGFAAILDGLIVHRHDNELRTVLTTNMEGDAFAVAYGARIHDRIRSTGGFYELDEESMRGGGDEGGGA